MLSRRLVVTGAFSSYACLHYYQAIDQFELIEKLPGQGVITYPILIIGSIVAVFLCVHGLHQFFKQVHGKLELTQEHAVARYTLPDDKKELVLAPPVQVGLGGVLLGLVIWLSLGDPVFLQRAVVCFIGQGFAPAFGANGYYAGNFFELIFVSSVIGAQKLVLKV